MSAPRNNADPGIVPEKRRSFTSQKLWVEKAARSDPMMTDGEFRMFGLVLHATNEQTGIAIVGDDQIIDEIPCVGSRYTCRAMRKRIKALGYWDYEPGRGGKATRYMISAAPVNRVLDMPYGGPR